MSWFIVKDIAKDTGAQLEEEEHRVSRFQHRGLSPSGVRSYHPPDVWTRSATQKLSEL